MKTLKKQHGGSFKKSLTPALALLACLSLGFITPDIASAQIYSDIVVLGGGGGGGGDTGGGVGGAGGAGIDYGPGAAVSGGGGKGGDYNTTGGVLGGDPGSGSAGPDTGNGGGAGVNGGGGGGAAVLDVDGLTDAGSVSVNLDGAAGSSTTGGAGGSANLTLDAGNIYINNIDLRSGYDGNNAVVSGGNGGQGGEVRLNGSTSTNLVLQNTIDITANNGNAAEVLVNSLTVKSGAAATIDMNGLGATFDAGTINIGDGVHTTSLAFTGANGLWNNAETGTLNLNRGTLDLSDHDAFSGGVTPVYFGNNINTFGGGNYILGDQQVNLRFTDSGGQYINFDLRGMGAGEAALTFDNYGGLDLGDFADARINNTDSRGLIQMASTLPQTRINLIHFDGSFTMTNESTFIGKLEANHGSTVVAQYGVGTFVPYGFFDNGVGTYIYMEQNAPATTGFGLLSDAGAAQILTMTNSYRQTIDAINKISHRNEEGFKLYLNLDGGSYDNSVGSHVEVDTFGATLALGYTVTGTTGSMTVGGFAEAGTGSYEAFNNLVYLGQTRGKGHTRYFGGGLFATTSFDSGLHLEASARVGTSDNDFQYLNHLPIRYDDVSSTYYGAHIGAGYKFKPSWNRGEFDIYDNFAWTRMNGHDLVLSDFEVVSLSDMDSLRNRLGVRYTHTYEQGTELYAGLAWDHEFDGRAEIRTHNGLWTVNNEFAAETKGSSAFIEAGVRLNPESVPVSIDLGVFGSVGQNEGIGGTVGFKWEF